METDSKEVRARQSHVKRFRVWIMTRTRIGSLDKKTKRNQGMEKLPSLPFPNDTHRSRTMASGSAVQGSLRQSL